MSLFIDGYNLIFAASKKRMPGFNIGQTEAARDRLLALLAKYKSLRSERMTVFFDGGAEAAHLPRRQMARGMDIFFSDAKSNADADIKNAVSHDDQPRGIRVVTSDREIQTFVKHYGASVTDSDAFLDEVQELLRDSALPEDEPIEKYEGTAGGDADYWLKIFGGDDEKK